MIQKFWKENETFILIWLIVFFYFLIQIKSQSYTELSDIKNSSVYIDTLKIREDILYYSDTSSIKYINKIEKNWLENRTELEFEDYIIDRVFIIKK